VVLCCAQHNTTKYNIDAKDAEEDLNQPKTILQASTDFLSENGYLKALQSTSHIPHPTSHIPRPTSHFSFPDFYFQLYSLLPTVHSPHFNFLSRHSSRTKPDQLSAFSFTTPPGVLES
jgi:hypothetical protein